MSDDATAPWLQLTLEAIDHSPEQLEDALLQAGVNTAFPETLEASLRRAAEALQALGISTDETDMLLNGVRSTDYELVRYGPEGIPAPSAVKEG